jgi:hypothetical protein
LKKKFFGNKWKRGRGGERRAGKEREIMIEVDKKMER